MEWKEVRLGDVCTRVCSGGTPKSTNLSYYGGEIPWLNTKEIDFNRIYSTEKTITDSGLNNSSAKWIVPNTVTVAMYGATAGKSCIVKVPMTTNQACCNLTINDEVADYEFVYYSLKNDYTTLASLANGGAQQNLNAQIIKDYVLKMPSLADQRRIASILSSLDRKIELNNKINADLEEMAQAIFKNWFVDFEPFKDGKFVVSELGMIPEGWKVVAFDNILKVTTTKTGKEGIPEYSVTNTGIHPRDEKFTKNLSKSSAKNKLIRKGNLVFGMSREILNWGIMKEEIGGVSSAYNVYIVDEKIVSTTYLEYFIAQRMDYFADLIKPASREGQGVDKALLMKKIICIPPSEVMDVFLEKYNSIKLLTEIRNQESSRLSLLRDTLLPRLMSGELEVPE